MTDPLLSPLRLGDLEARNSIAMAPCTRCMSPDAIPTPDMAGYYGRRAADGVGLLISEGTIISQRANGYPDVPGIWSEEQVEAWSKVTAEVHRGGGLIVCQIWHTGAYAHPLLNGGLPSESPSGIVPEGFHSRLRDEEGNRVAYEPGEPMGETRIREVIQEFHRAAVHAREAGFDGVEIHGAHTYLIDQFLNLNWNQRDDEWGRGSRCRFAGEVARAVVEELGAGRVLFRFSPHWTAGQRSWKQTAETLPLLLSTLWESGVRILHASSPSYDLPTIPVEALPAESRDAAQADSEGLVPLHRATRLLWPGQLLGVGELDLDRARGALADQEIDMAAFGRPLIANPRFVTRVREGMPLREYTPDMLMRLD